MKKFAAAILCIVLCLTLLCACGRKTDSDGNTLISSDWRCVSYTVNDTHTEIADIPFYARLFLDKDSPKFKCDDGYNFTFTLLQKSHSGTVTLNDDGTYLLTTETGKTLFAKIAGNTLMIYTEEGNVEINFQTS